MRSFADFVAEDAEQNGAFVHYGWLHGEPHVSPLRRKTDSNCRILATTEREGPNDWSFSAGWDILGYSAYIIRGTERLLIKVRGKQALRLLKIQDALEAEIKAAKKRAKLKKKAKTIDAAYL
jgi:hypothetical protein